MRTYVCSSCVCIIAIALVIAGCSNEQIYNSTQAAKEGECQKIIDAGERGRCLDEAHKSYDTYKRQRDESIKN